MGLFSKVVPSASDAQAKSDKYLNRTKFVIACGCLEATMIEAAESVVTFEVNHFLYKHLADAISDARSFTNIFEDHAVLYLSQVSCGEFGNANSLSIEPTNSVTQPTQPLFDSTKYYYLNWDAAGWLGFCSFAKLST